MTNGSTITTTDYLDGFQYNENFLEFFPHPEGYVKATPTSLNQNNPEYSFNYVFNYTDHLGNVRVSYTKDPQTGNLKILDESHYYPFGLKHQEYSTFGFVSNPIQEVVIAPLTNNPYKYKYNGKEWQDELSLNMYDMDMRQYDPAIARWVVMDPVIHHSMSPYSAFDNNPVFWADPSGAAPELGSVFEQSGMKVASLTVQGTGVSIGAGGAGDNNNSNGKKNNAAIEIANEVEIAPGRYAEIEPKDEKIGDWEYMNVESLDEAVTKLEAYLNGDKLDNLLLITHGRDDGIILANTNADMIGPQELNSNNSYAKSLLTLMSFVKDGGNVIFGSCYTGRTDAFGQTLHQLTDYRYNLFINNDYSSFKFTRNQNGSVNRNIKGPITSLNHYKYGWDYIKAGDNTSSIKNLRNVTISLKNDPIRLKEN